MTFEEIRELFYQAIVDDKEAQRLYKVISSGKGTYKTASQLAVRVGHDLGKVLKRYFPVEGEPLDWNIEELIPKVLGLDHRIVIDACRDVQNQMNADAHIGMKYQEPLFNMDRAQGIVTELRDHPVFSDIEKSFLDQLENFSQNIVDDSIRDNAAAMWRAGVKSLIVRQVDSKPCEWCSNLAGSYDYGEVSDTGNDVWRRHENCRCTIDYITTRNSGLYTERVNNQKK